MTLREHISIARRSWRLLYSMSRRFFAAILAYSVVTALLPYIPVWFSARLIDALAAGITLSTLQVNIFLAAGLIGCTTFVISIAGVYVGNVFGSRYKSRAELTGGVILILIGLKILLEHLGVIAF